MQLGNKADNGKYVFCTWCQYCYQDRQIITETNEQIGDNAGCHLHYLVRA